MIFENRLSDHVYTTISHCRTYSDIDPTLLHVQRMTKHIAYSDWYNNLITEKFTYCGMQEVISVYERIYAGDLNVRGSKRLANVLTCFQVTPEAVLWPSLLLHWFGHAMLVAVLVLPPGIGFRYTFKFNLLLKCMHVMVWYIYMYFRLIFTIFTHPI